MLDAKTVLMLFDKLQSSRAVWETHWQDIGELIWPDTADFTDQHRVPGEKRMQRVFDSTAALALDRFASAMESLLTPRNQKWHRLKAGNKDLDKLPEVKEFFDDLTNQLFFMRDRPSANYFGAMHEGYKSDGSYGTSGVFLDDLPGGGFRYRTDPLSQLYLSSDANGTINTAFRKYKLSAHAATEKWGERLPAVITGAADPYTEFDFVLGILPNPNYQPDSIDPREMLFTAYEISVEGQLLVEVSGYHEMPYIIGRYTRNAGEVYGRSPGMMVLPDVQTLQEQEKTFLEAGHRAVAPPLLLQDDGVIAGGGSRRPRLMPDGLNYGALDSQGRELIKPLITGARLDLTEGMMEKKREIINAAFFVNLFQILVEEIGTMTATEVLERKTEKGQLLAPLVGRQQSEKLGPQISREIAILDRQGLIPDLPPVLLEAEGEYEIEYDSPATRFQRLEEISGLSRTVEVWAPWIQADPTLLTRSVKVPEGFRETATLMGVPGAWLTSDEEQKEILAEQEQQAQQAVEAENLAKEAQAAQSLVNAAATAEQSAS